MKFIANNNAASSLAGSITNVATTIQLQVGSGALFPNPTVGEEYFVGTLTDSATETDHEIVWVTERVGDTLTVMRAQEGTSAQAWLANDLFDNMVTAGQMLANVQAEEAQAQSFSFGVDTGSVNAYVVAFTPVISVAPPDGTPLRVKILHNNTAASTMDAGWGAVGIVRRDNSNLIGGELLAGMYAQFIWKDAAGKLQLQGAQPATAAAISAATDTQSIVTPAQLGGASFSPIGMGPLPWSGIALPSQAGWDWADGAAISRVTFATYLGVITQTHTVTLTIASPCVATWNSHPLVVGDVISFETTGGLPTGISTATNYYVIVTSANTFRFGALQTGLNNVITAASWSGGDITYTTTSPHGLTAGSLVVINGNNPVGYNGVFICNAGTTGSTIIVNTSNPGALVDGGQVIGAIAIVNTTGSQSGVQTVRLNPFGCGDGSTTFNKPDMRGRGISGPDSFRSTPGAAGRLGGAYSLGGFITAAAGNAAGEQAHNQIVAEIGAHSHTTDGQSGGAAAGISAIPAGQTQTGTTGGSDDMNIMQPTLLVPWIVKTA